MRDRGFTFIEVLFALLILSWIGLAAGHSIVLALRTEAQSAQQRQAALLLLQRQTALWLPPVARGELVDPLPALSRTYSGSDDAHAPRWLLYPLFPGDTTPSYHYAHPHPL